MLELREVSKDFSDFRLEPFSVTIEKGEFFSILGPSGCGKTTLLRMMGGFETPTRGSIFLEGREVTQVPSFQRNIHTVFQRYGLFPHLNVFENVAFSLRIKRLPTLEISRRVEEAMDLVEIRSLAGRRVQELSGGQAQRVAIARAVVDRPSVLLLDEPLSALDTELRVKMRLELRRLCKTLSIAFILVTHDQEEALLLSDRLAVLKAGKCLQLGPAKALYEDPVDPFVASFLGPINEISGRVGSEMEGFFGVESSLGFFKIRKNGVLPPPNIKMLIRPEKLRLLRQKSQTQDNIAEGTILELNYLGSRTEYTVQLQGFRFRSFEQEQDRSNKRGLQVGDKIYLAWKPEDTMVFADS